MQVIINASVFAINVDYFLLQIVLTVKHRTPDIGIFEARKSSHVDVRGEFLSPFLIDTCEILLQIHFLTVLIHRCIFLTTTNGQQKL